MIFSATVWNEPDGSVTLALDDLDLVVNADSTEAATAALCRVMVEYAEEYQENFARYSAAPNRAAHVPLVAAILAAAPEELQAAISLHSGDTPRSPRAKRPHKTVAERLEDYSAATGTSFEPVKEAEIDWGGPHGEELL